MRSCLTGFVYVFLLGAGVLILAGPGYGNARKEGVDIAQSDIAPENPLNSSAIRRYLFGQSMIGEYSNGLQWSEDFNADGTTLYREPPGLAIHGSMHVQNGRLCFSYGMEAPVTGGCFEVWKRTGNCFDFIALHQRLKGQT